MRIAIPLADLDEATTSSLGILNVSVGLARALSHHELVSRLLVLAHDEQDLELGARATVVRVGAPMRTARERAAWDWRGLHRRLGNADLDWLLLPRGYYGRVPRHLAVASFIHDDIFQFYRANFPGHFGTIKLAYLTGTQKRARHRSDAILTSTRFVASEIASSCSVPPSVVGIGFDPPQRWAVAPQDRTGILAFVSPHPHKRSARTLAQLADWWSAQPDQPPVVLIGSLDPAATSLVHPSWQYLDRPHRPVVVEQLEQARVVVHGSSYEGFGMIPVEALLAGAVPVYSAIPASMEVMGGRGAPFGEADGASFARAMDAALRLTNAQVRDAADSVSARYRWADVADRVVARLQAGSGSGG